LIDISILFCQTNPDSFKSGTIKVRKEIRKDSLTPNAFPIIATSTSFSRCSDTAIVSLNLYVTEKQVKIAEETFSTPTIVGYCQEDPNVVFKNYIFKFKSRHHISDNATIYIDNINALSSSTKAKIKFETIIYKNGGRLK